MQLRIGRDTAGSDGRERNTHALGGMAATTGLVMGSAHAADKLKVGDLPPDHLGKATSGEAIQLSAYRGQISVNWRESAQQFRAIRKALKETLESGGLTLVSDASGAIGSRYGVQAIPHMIIIGRDGRIAAIHIGYAEDALPDLIDEINALWTKTDP